MTTIIWKPCSPHGTCKSRYKQRRAALQAQKQRDKRLAKEIEQRLMGCSARVINALKHLE